LKRYGVSHIVLSPLPAFQARLWLNKKKQSLLAAMADSKIEDMAMLYHVCSERNIMLSPAMTEYYRELNANLVLEEGLQDSRRWTEKAVS
jgi:hypothetical protein